MAGQQAFNNDYGMASNWAGAEKSKLAAYQTKIQVKNKSNRKTPKFLAASDMNLMN